MPSFKPAIVFVALAVAGCSQTHSLDDPGTGLKVSIEGDYLVEPWELQPPYTAMIAVKGRGGHPFISDDTVTPICVVAFQPMPENASYTQAEINANIPQWAEGFEEDLSQLMRFESREPFEHKGISGYQFIASPNGAFTAKMRIIVSVLETPKGRTAVNCSGNAETLQQAMPTYDLIRGGVTPP